MKKCQKALLTLIPSFFALALAVPVASALAPTETYVGEDTAIYDDDLKHAKLEAPDITNIKRADDDEEGEVTVEVHKVILHYYNEAGGCKGRAFYIWATGVDGLEYSDELNNEGGSAVTYKDDGTEMTITMDFVTDQRFTYLDDRAGLWFIIKFKRQGTNMNWGGQSDDTFLRYSDFEETVKDGVLEVWSMPAAGGGIALLDMEEKTRVPGIKLAQFTDWKTIKCDVSQESNKIWWKLYAFDETYFRIKPKKREAEKSKYLVMSVDDQTVPASKTFNITFKYEAHPNVVYSLESHDPASDSTPGMNVLNKVSTVGFTTLYDSPRFHKYYEYEYGVTKAENAYFDNLGMTYTKEATTFKVWSPMSANITLMIYNSDTSAEYGGEDKYTGYHMHYTKGGIWQLTVDGDLAGLYYNYQVDNILGTNICMDPYATSAGACGVRGFIYDKNGEDAKPEGWDALPLKWDGETTKGLDIATPQELSVYEVHLQDFTGDSSWNGTSKKGTYNAFVEGDTKVAGTSISTGYDHLNELGIKAVQLMPMFDHDNDERPEKMKYNWGYNPLNYNIVEGGYSSDPHDGMARVKEFRNLVLEMSKTDAHTRVIMDVVYNHVSSATGSCFHKLMPRYYFRYSNYDYYYIKDWRGDFFKENGHFYCYDDGVKKLADGWGEFVKYVEAGELFDGSGCHNEVDSDRRMMRKFIVDSLCMWSKDYKVKGFRFDLMGLLDFETLNQARKELYKIDPDIYLYGEGWTSGGYHGDGTVFHDQSHPTETPRSQQMTGRPSVNYSTETYQIYHETNNFKVPGGVYLGGFNDTFRNSMRGENNIGGYPGAGTVQAKDNKIRRSQEEGGDYLRTWSIAQAMWGANVDKDGYYPEQTVNYVSCHDNWTVRDQLYNTMNEGAPASAEQLIRASIQAHAITMAGNATAFMLGGEELFRTKELTPEDIAAIEKGTVAPGDVAVMHGHTLSHNSYNLSIGCNSFKWGNKVKITVDYTSAENSTYHYIEKFQEMVKMHNKQTFRRGVNVETAADKYQTFINAGYDITWGGKGYENGFGMITGSGTVIVCALNVDASNAWVEIRNNNPYDLDHKNLFQYGAGEEEASMTYEDYDEYGTPISNRRLISFTVPNAIRIYYGSK